jgi:hypothetical protein
MALARAHTWSSGEVLLASELNAEFDNIINNARDLISPLTASLDLNGVELILDADADTSMTADTDDQVDFKIGGSDIFAMIATEFRMGGANYAQHDSVVLAQQVFG